MESNQTMGIFLKLTGVLLKQSLKSTTLVTAVDLAISITVAIDSLTRSIDFILDLDN